MSPVDRPGRIFRQSMQTLRLNSPAGVGKYILAHGHRPKSPLDLSTRTERNVQAEVNRIADSSVQMGSLPLLINNSTTPCISSFSLWSSWMRFIHRYLSFFLRSASSSAWRMSSVSSALRSLVFSFVLHARDISSCECKMVIWAM
jgi:hypothetical protein